MSVVHATVQVGVFCGPDELAFVDSTYVNGVTFSRHSLSKSCGSLLLLQVVTSLVSQLLHTVVQGNS